MNSDVPRPAVTRERSAVLFVSLSIALLVAWLLFSGDTSTEITDTETMSDVAAPVAKTEVDSETDTQDDFSSRVPTDSEQAAAVGDFTIPLTAMLEATEAARIWREEHGYEDRSMDYYGMTNQELEHLARAGDQYAAAKLASSYRLSNPESATEFFELAASNGSTRSLVALADMWFVRQGSSIPEDSGSDIEKPANTGLAYAVVALHRGDNVFGASAVDKLLDRGAYSEDDINDVCSTSQTIYSRIATQRESIGFQPFDNTPSSSGEVLTLISLRGEDCRSTLLARMNEL